MQDRRAGCERLVDRKHRRQRLVVDLDRRGGLAGDLGIGRGDCRYHLADVAHLAARDHRLVLDDAARARPVEIGAGEDRLDAGDRARRVHPIADDPRVGVRAGQERGVQHAGQLDVVGVLGATGRLVACLQARGARTDRHRRPPARLLRRLDDLHVAGAAAKVARQRVADRLASGTRLAREKLGERDDEPRRAEAALDGARVDQGALHHREIVVAGEAFDRRDRPLADVGGERQAGTGELSVEQHGAGAADAVIAAALGAGQAERGAQHLEQRRRRRGEHVAQLAVNGQHRM